MKKLLFLFLLLPFYSFAQPCADEDTVRSNAVTLITANTARVNGTTTHFSGSVLSMQLRYVRVGQTDTATASAAGTSALRNLTGLQAGTQYVYYYKSICGSGSISQTIGPYTFTTLTSTVVYAAERSTVFPYVKVDTGFTIPRLDTGSLYRAADIGGNIRFRPADSLPYYYNGEIWKVLAVDSAGILPALNLKVDSVTVAGDSLFYWVNGVSYGYILGTLASNWHTTGNASTSPGTNFVGTTDAQALWINTNGYNRLIIPSGGIASSTDATDSVLVTKTDGVTLGKIAKSALLAGITASNGLTMASSNVKLGGTLIEATQIDGDGTYGLEMSNITNLVFEANTNIDLNALNGSHTTGIGVSPTLLTLTPHVGNLYIDTLTSAVGTKSLRYNPTSGLVSYADTTAGGGLSGLTTNELVYGNSATTIASLPVATYPSLTELSYVKGVTSAIQTQLDAKADITSRDIVYITQPTTGAALSSGWSAVGSPSYTVSNGQFVFSGGANNVTQWIQNDLGVLAEQVTLEAYVIINTTGVNNQGPRIGFSAYGNGDWNVNAGFVTGSSATGAGKVVLYSRAGALQYSDSANTNYANGDTLYYKLTRTGCNYTMMVENLTKDWKLAKTVVGNASTFIAHGSANIAAYPGEGAYTLYGLTYTINTVGLVDLMVVGNSITYLQEATTQEYRYAQRIGNPELNIASGGGADQIVDVYNRLGEIIAINPRAVTLMIGGNDILFAGTLNTTAKNNYIAIRDSLVNNGIKVIHLLPTPRSGTDLRALVNFIDTSYTFKSDKVVRGTWVNLLTGSYSLLAQYDGGDGTHPNNAGMAAIAAAINEELNFPNGNEMLPNKNLIAKNGYLWGTDAGTGYNNFKAGGLIAQKFNFPTSYTQIGYTGNTGYVQALTEGSAYEDFLINPSGGDVGIGEGTPTSKLHVSSTSAGNVEALQLNRVNFFGAANDEIRINFAYNNVNLARVANYYYVDGGGRYGLRFYTYYTGAMNTTPNVDMKADLSTLFNGRLQMKQGADVASTAGAMTLGSNGNTFEITGTNSITLLSNVGWQNGSEVTLMFTGAATLTHATATSGTDITMILAGAANFVASADDTITLVLGEIGGVQAWREKCRSVN
jgi:lysophospholipase L1-like esterase